MIKILFSIERWSFPDKKKMGRLFFFWLFSITKRGEGRGNGGVERREVFFFYEFQKFELKKKKKK